jgi:uncharacterized YigZ family protein
MLKDSYLTIKDSSIAELKIKRSKFISQAVPVKNQLLIPRIIDEIKKKYFDASHHPYAFRVGIKADNFRVNDDGEPSGSSGKPILEAIDKYKLSDILVVVTRYFGGTKLGVGGLRRAYFLSAEAALEKAKIIEVILCDKFTLDFNYKYIKDVMKYLEKNKIKVIENYSGERAVLKIEVRESFEKKFKKDISDITKGKFIIEKINQQ